MSRENVEVVRGTFENFLAGRSDFGVELLDPEVEWDATDGGVPDMAAVYRGGGGRAEVLARVARRVGNSPVRL